MRKRIAVGGLLFDPLTQAEVVDLVCTSALRREGGWIVTPNTDFLWLVAKQPQLSRVFSCATLSVADGTPILWATQLLGTPLPERVCGADLLVSLCAGSARAGLSVFFLGGAPGVGEAAWGRLSNNFEGLRLAGYMSPPLGFESDLEQIRAIVERLEQCRPNIVFCALGTPKQERLIHYLSPLFPDVWFLGCGAALDFAAGSKQRSPLWLQRLGGEWLFRLLTEPRRLANRYLIRDLPLAVALLVKSAFRRLLQERKR